VDKDLRLVQIPGWNRFGWLRHGFSTRSGGETIVYGDDGALNLGWTQDDDPAAVAENRQRLVQAVGGGSLVTIRQVHGAVTRAVREGDGAFEGRLQTAEGKAVLQGDGLMTNVAGVLLGIQTADCVPVLAVDARQRVVAAFHAGWRGTAARMVEHGIAAMRTEYDSRPEDLIAAVGPSIGACCYAVGDEVKQAFEANFTYGGELLQRVGAETRLDLWEANRRQLLDAGVAAEKIFVVAECSGCALDDAGQRLYFSHRVDKGVTGRMMSVVGIVGGT
jgi:purine-nucleoside/S-methyl-5'-thioadenosine phosphorylase / adenosine deaminase